jgi:serine/threonine protein kinase
MAPHAGTSPLIPDYELVRCIGQGSYGEVWLARTVFGAYRAVKMIYRQTFKDDRPFEREFEGAKNFERVSRLHPGLVAVLHVGRAVQAKAFYYVMEVADDPVSGQEIDPSRYVPKTVASELSQRGRLPLGECVSLSLALTSALGCLHQHGLVHRDIKPSNIIFIAGQPKFADIGLVTLLGEPASFVGTAGYVPPEGPGSAAADIYALGKVIYQMCTGKSVDGFPELPIDLDTACSKPAFLRLNEVILRACDPNCLRRYQSAEELRDALDSIVVLLGSSASPDGEPHRADSPTGGRTTGPPARESRPGVPSASPGAGNGVRAEMHGPSGGLRAATGEPRPMGSVSNPPSRICQVAILCRSTAPPEKHLLDLLTRHLERRGHGVFHDGNLTIGLNWALEIETRLRRADAVIVLLSPHSVQSEMIAYEVETAWEAARKQHGRPRLLPVRVGLTERLPDSLGRCLSRAEQFHWASEEDDNRVVEEVIRAMESATAAMPPSTGGDWDEPIGGAVPLDSRFYVVRPSDREFQSAIARHDSVVLVKGARQMGKTSLLARGVQQARASGARVVLADFQKLNASHLASVEAFFMSLGHVLADQLDLDTPLEDRWDRRRSPNANFERYLRRDILGGLSSHLVWGLDEVDRLFTCDFGSEVFGLFRSWHNERALDPSGPWSRLTLAIAYATEAHLFITDINQSPFNVGTRLSLDDFTLDQVGDLNRRYGSPLRSPADLQRFFKLVGGQPYLVRGGLKQLAAEAVSFEEFIAGADRDEGVFGDHLRRILVLLAKDAELAEVVRGILRSGACAALSHFYRLRSAGLIAGDSPHQVRPRCGIYDSYLRHHLL